MMRITFFTAALFAVAFSSGFYVTGYNLRKNGVTRKAAAYAVCVICAVVLALSAFAGAAAAKAAVPGYAQAGCFLFLGILAVKRILELKQNNNLSSIKDNTVITSAEAAVAGFGAGLGGLNIVYTVILCAFLNVYFLYTGSVTAETDCKKDLTLPALSSALFLSLIFIM
jgi:hypothetical protein